jgi:hypothetical protein
VQSTSRNDENGLKINTRIDENIYDEAKSPNMSVKTK